MLDRLLGRPPRPRAYSPNRWSAAEVERRIEHEPIEWVYVFGPQGDQMFRRRGSADSVSLGEEVSALRDAMLIHNHPVGPGDVAETLTFSTVDVVFAVTYDLAEMRVVAPGWRFVLERPPGGWPGDEEVVMARHREVSTLVNVELSLAFAEGTISAFDRLVAERREVWRRLDREGWLIYREERR